jgi:hypothetical protein
MKTITLSAYNRPMYLKEVLEAIKANDTSGYHLVICLEPGCKPVVDLCTAIDWIDVTIFINEKKLGVRQNPYNAIAYAFGTLKSDFNICQEDDVTVSPDFFNLANWYYDTFKSDPLKYMSYGMFCYDSNRNYPNELIEVAGFTGLGWSCFKENWKILDRFWFNDAITERHNMGIGWDHSFNAAYKEYKYKGLIPKYARSCHIGRLSGTHALPDFHDRVFGNLDYNKELNIKDFVIV